MRANLYKALMKDPKAMAMESFLSCITTTLDWRKTMLHNEVYNTYQQAATNLEWYRNDPKQRQAQSQLNNTNSINKHLL